jgi:hypothetical protein
MFTNPILTSKNIEIGEIIRLNVVTEVQTLVSSIVCGSFKYDPCFFCPYVDKVAHIT